MESNEWPLIFFTLLGQTAAGLVFTLALLSAGRKEVLKLIYSSVNRPATFFALGLMTAAGLFSFFHLGSSSNAIYALGNLRSSWLSREIFMVILFGTLLAAKSVFSLIFNERERINRIILWMCLLAGSAMIYSMARVYMVSVIPSWNQASTLVKFFSGSLLPGIPFFLSIVIARNSVYPGTPGVAGFIRLLASIVFFAFLVRISFDMLSGSPVGDTGFPPPQIPVLAGFVHYSLLAAGSGIFMAWAFMRPETGKRLQKILVPASFFLLLLGEVLGKYIFYSGYYRIGV